MLGLQIDDSFGKTLKLTIFNQLPHFFSPPRLRLMAYLHRTYRVVLELLQEVFGRELVIDLDRTNAASTQAGNDCFFERV